MFDTNQGRTVIGQTVPRRRYLTLDSHTEANTVENWLQEFAFAWNQLI